MTFNIMSEKTTVDLMSTLVRIYEKPSASNKVFLMKRLFNMKIIDGGFVVEHLNNFNTMMSQLCSIDIKFVDEIRALLLLSSLLKSWNGLITMVNNSSGSAKLNFDDIIGLMLSEKICKRVKNDSSGSALNIENRGRNDDRSFNI